jgi:hypothetical protein
MEDRQKLILNFQDNLSSLKNMASKLQPSHEISVSESYLSEGKDAHLIIKEDRIEHCISKIDNLMSDVSTRLRSKPLIEGAIQEKKDYTRTDRDHQDHYLTSLRNLPQVNPQKASIHYTIVPPASRKLRKNPLGISAGGGRSRKISDSAYTKSGLGFENSDEKTESALYPDLEFSPDAKNLIDEDQYSPHYVNTREKAISETKFAEHGSGAVRNKTGKVA